MEFKLFSDETVKLHVFIDEASETVKVKLEPISKVLWSGKFFARPKITLDKILQVRTYFQVPHYLELQPKILDQSRIHPRYAKYFNHRYRLFNTLLFNDDIPSQEIQRSYGDGLSFIGNAILQFVASLIVFYQNEENMSKAMMEQKVRYLVDSTYLASLCQYSEWDSMLAYNSKKLSPDCKKGEKVYSDQLKGWLGALYVSNPMENLPEVLEVAKKMLSLETKFNFDSLVKSEYDRNSLLFGGFIGFGLGMLPILMFCCFQLYYVML